MQENPIYDFLKANGLTDKDEATFLKEYGDSTKAKQLHQFFQENKLTDKGFDDFYGSYLKKKVGGDVLPNGSTPTPLPSKAPSLSAGDITKIKDFVTGTTQEQRNAEKTAQAKQVLPTQKPVVAAQPLKKLSPKEVTQKAKETFEDPLFQSWLQKSEDPIGELKREAQAKGSAPVDINNYDASVLHNQNEGALSGHMADVVKEGLFEGGHDAAEYLKKRGVGQGLPRPLNETEQVAVQKVEAAKEKNSLLNQYSLEEAALRKAFPDLTGKTVEQLKRENNAQAGQAYAQFISDPDVQNRAKHDPKLRLQLIRAENTLVQHYPEYASAQIASKISQKLEDAGETHWLVNNPTKERADWAIAQLEKEGKLSPDEKKLYEKDLVPKIQKATSWTNELAQAIPIANVFADENPIKSSGIMENLIGSFRNTLKGGAKTIEEATVAPVLSLTSQNGLTDFHNKGINEQLGQAQFEPKGMGKYTSTFGNIAGMIVPTIMGAGGLKALGAGETVANGLAFALTTAGQHQADARELFKGNIAIQPVYTAVMSAVDYALGGGLAKAFSKGVGSVVKQDVADAIKGYTSGEISGAAASDMVKHSLIKNGFDFVKETAKHNLKGGGMMAAPILVDAALQNAFGDHPPQFKEAVEQAIEHAQTGFWASTPLSAVAAMGSRANRMNARMYYEQASRPAFREELVKNGATPEQLKNYDVAQKILKELRAGDVATKDLPQLLLHELNQKILSEKASATESPSLKARIKERISLSKEKAETILNRQEANLRPQDAGEIFYEKSKPSVIAPSENKTEVITVAPKETVKEEKKGAKVILPQSNRPNEVITVKPPQDVTEPTEAIPSTTAVESSGSETVGSNTGERLHTVDSSKERIGKEEGERKPSVDVKRDDVEKRRQDELKTIDDKKNAVKNAKTKDELIAATKEYANVNPYDASVMGSNIRSPLMTPGRFEEGKQALLKEIESWKVEEIRRKQVNEKYDKELAALEKTKPTVDSSEKGVGEKEGSEAIKEDSERSSNMIATSKANINANKVRQSRVNSIEFKRPIVGKNGAKLLSYTWESKDFGKDKEGRTIRFSDWEKAGVNADTGRNIVHKFKVEVDGKVLEVSADSVAKVLGFTNAEMDKVFPKAKDFVKQLAVMKMKEQALVDELATSDEAVANAVKSVSEKYGVDIPVKTESDKVIASSFGMPKDDVKIGDQYADDLVREELRKNGVYFSERQNAGKELNRIRQLIENKKKQAAQFGEIDFAEKPNQSETPERSVATEDQSGNQTLTPKKEIPSTNEIPIPSKEESTPTPELNKNSQGAEEGSGEKKPEAKRSLNEWADSRPEYFFPNVEKDKYETLGEYLKSFKGKRTKEELLLHWEKITGAKPLEATEEMIAERDRLSAEEPKGAKSEANPAETKPTVAPKPKAQAKEIFHQEVDKKADALINFLTPKTTKGVKKQGLGVEEIVRAGADAIKKAYSISLDAREAIEKGIQKMKDLWEEKELGAFPEKDIRSHFEEAYKEAEPPKDGEPPLKGQSESTDGGDNWTAIRKEKLKEIAKIKEHFEKENGTTWGKIQQEGLEKAASIYPDKTVPEAVAAYTKKVAAMYDAKEDYNPTARDLAIFQEFKRQTEQKIKSTQKHLDSDNHIELMAAVSEVEGYEADLLTAAKAINPREAGTAFGFRASESRNDPDYGLQIRKMQLIRSKGGEQLTDSERSWLQKQWAKEKEIMQQEAALREQGMQEEFDKRIEQLKKAYETQLQKKRAGKPTEKQSRVVRHQALSKKGKEIADKIRQFKTPKDGLKMDFSLGTWDLAVEGIAQLVEKGVTVIDAIDTMIKEKKIAFKTDKDREAFEDKFAGMLDRSELRDGALEKLKEFSDETDLTSDMVAKGIVRDFVNSFIGEVEQKDILDAATKELQEYLPSVTKKRLIEAYLKEGEFKQPTKKELENSLAQQKKELVSIAKLTEDLEDLQGLKSLRQRSFPTEREKSEYEKSLYDKKQAKLKELIAERNRVAKAERDAQKRKDKLQELNANIERAKQGLDLITTFRNKSEAVIDAEIVKKRKELSRTVKENLPEDKEQALKLKNLKEKAKRDIKELQRKIAEKEYREDTEPVVLKKADAEYIRLQKQKADLQAEYAKVYRQLEEQNKHWSERLADFGRSVYVALLIGGLKTLAKVGAMSVIRPFSEAGTKLTAGKVFDLFFPGISKAAKRGGESSSLRSVQAGFAAYFKQMGAKAMEEKYEKTNAAFEKADAIYQEAKADGMSEKELAALKTDRDNKMLAAMGSVVYKYIGGSSFKDAAQALVKRANEIEHQMGGVEKEEWRGKILSIPKSGWTALDNISYTLGFVGRSHSALKTFSGRFSFAAGFMARLEQAQKDGIDITRHDKLLELGHESYLDWERGKYQQENAITRWWNRNVLGNRPDSDYPNWENSYKAIRQFVKADVAITRVPVNILHESVMEYTLGVFRAIHGAMKAKKIATKEAKELGFLIKTPEFREKVREIVSNMDEKQAATIARCFRKGSVGLGLYAFFLISGTMQFGTFPHLGQRKEKDDSEMGEDELNAGQIKLFGKKLGHTLSGIVEHIPALWTALMGLGLAHEYKTQVEKGKTTPQAVWKSIYTHLEIVQGGVPQFKIIKPLETITGLIKPVEKRADEWGLIDEDEDEGKPKPPKPHRPSKPKKGG